MPETDLAVLKINSDRMFKTVSFHQGDDLRIGDWVVAIGNPFGIGQSTSFGIISAIGRERVESGAYVDYIQTDATINTGNSGGPLFNPEGDVVGVNSAIYSPTGASVGIAFSIPHETAEAVVTQLRREGAARQLIMLCQEVPPIFTACGLMTSFLISIVKPCVIQPKLRASSAVCVLIKKWT